MEYQSTESNRGTLYFSATPVPKVLFRVDSGVMNQDSWYNVSVMDTGRPELGWRPLGLGAFHSGTRGVNAMPVDASERLKWGLHTGQKNVIPVDESRAYTWDVLLPDGSNTTTKHPKKIQSRHFLMHIPTHRLFPENQIFRIKLHT
jgi:hypothetical protein